MALATTQLCDIKHVLYITYNILHYIIDLLNETAIYPSLIPRWLNDFFITNRNLTLYICLSYRWSDMRGLFNLPIKYSLQLLVVHNCRFRRI